MSQPVAVVSSQLRWEEKAIIACLERRGASFAQVDPRRLRAGLADAPRWRVALNREISWTRACYAGHTLEAQQTAVVNSAAATETCGDKWRTALALARRAVPTPRTELALSMEAALSAAERLGYPVVLKPLVSSWGRRVVRVRDAEAAAAVCEQVEALASPQARILCVQEFIDKPGRDIRVIVVGGQPLAAAYRESAQWRTNVSRRADPRRCPLTPEISKLAMEGARAADADVAGVDLVESADGRLLVLEVNHRVEFAGLQAAVPQVDVAAAIVDHVLTRADR